MRFDSSIFKAYDVRGIYPKELNEESAYGVGRAFVRLLRQESSDGRKKLTIAVGRDSRLSSPSLLKALIDGIRAEGGNVADLGLIGTPQIYFAVWRHRYDGSAMVSASHNPPAHNGVKFTRERAIILTEETGIGWMREYLIAHPELFEKKKRKKNDAWTRGALSRKRATKEYLSFLIRLVGLKKGEFKGFSVVLDGASGSGGELAQRALQYAGARIFPLCLKPDGRFPRHNPDPTIQENRADIVSLVQKSKARLGVAFDGDADRVVFVDERGDVISADLVVALLARQFVREDLKTKKEVNVLCDIRFSNVAAEEIRKAGGTPIFTRIGRGYIQQAARDRDVSFGAELVGHYTWGRGIFFEIPLAFLFLLMRIIRDGGVPASAAIAPMRRYFNSGEINFPIHDARGAIEKLRGRYRAGKETTIDGLKVEYKDWWFLARASHTEPLLRLLIEASTQEMLEQKKKELTAVLREFETIPSAG